jgi:NADPH:quinone reductase-like Zn-dependent oxidoreductase
MKVSLSRHTETSTFTSTCFNSTLIVIDYTKNDPTEVISPKSVDFILDTTGQAMQFLSLMNPSNSLIISISTQPSGAQLQESSMMRRPENPRLPWYANMALTLADAIRKFRARRWGVEYSYLFLDSNAEDLETITKYVEEGKLVPVIGTRVDMHDIEKVREACMLTYNGKGGLGKTVIDVIQG